MRPLVKQLGILPEYDGQTPADYAGADTQSLNRLVLRAIERAGFAGTTAGRLAGELGRTHKSISGRCTELHRLGLIRRAGTHPSGQALYVVSQLSKEAKGAQ